MISAYFGMLRGHLRVQELCLAWRSISVNDAAGGPSQKSTKSQIYLISCSKMIKNMLKNGWFGISGSRNWRPHSEKASFRGVERRTRKGPTFKGVERRSFQGVERCQIQDPSTTPPLRKAQPGSTEVQDPYRRVRMAVPRLMKQGKEEQGKACPGQSRIRSECKPGYVLNASSLPVRPLIIRLIFFRVRPSILPTTTQNNQVP